MSAASAEIQDEWARTFAREGYFIVERALEPDLLEGLRGDADTAIAEERESLQRGEDRYVPVSELDDRYVISGFVRRSEFVRRFIFGELAASICRAAIGGEAYLYSDTFVCMAPHNVHGWIWHQDSSYLDHVGCGHYPPNLGVWVALDDVTRDRGPLRVLPFSQVDYRKVVAHDLNKPWDSADVVDFGNPEGVLITVPAGSIVVTSGALPHASDPNRTDTPRRAYLIQYSQQPVLKDGKPVQMAVPFLQGGNRRVPTLDETQRA